MLLAAALALTARLASFHAAAADQAPSGPPADAQALFDQAVSAELGRDGRPDAGRAFALYRQAADSGLAAAQLHAAVMLDSGRGTKPDSAQAATYYALAASQGIGRAAYDLGQLYAVGEGLPKNSGLARAWLRQAAAEGVPAARDLLAALADRPDDAADGSPAPPIAVLPQGGATLARAGKLQFVWTASIQPAPAQFFIEVAALQAPARDVFTAMQEVSAVTVRIATPPGRYAWRVFTVCPTLGRYVPSPWTVFSIS